MATAVRPFRKFQGGIESTKGTLVAATRVLTGDTQFMEKRDRYFSDYPRGVAATVGAGGTTVKQWVDVEHKGELSAEDILWALLLGIRGSVTPTGAGTAKTWTFTPQLTTAVKTLDAATFEFMRSDGATNHYYGEAGYCMCSGFRIESDPEGIAQYGMTLFGRARQTDTPTAALVPYTSLEALAGGMLSVYVDTSWAGLGGTQLTGMQRKVIFNCDTGVRPQWNAQGRSDLDFAEHAAGLLKGKLNIEWEFDSVGASRYTSYRNGDIIYVRLKWVGSAISGGGNKTVQVDGAWRFAGDPTFVETNEQTYMSAALDAVYDSTGAKILEFTAINTLTAVA